MRQVNRLIALLVPPAAAAPALSPAQAAALDVFKFELVQGASLQAVQAGDHELAVRIRQGPVRLEEKFLGTLWPYRLGKAPESAVDLTDDPPYGKVMFPDAIRDLQARKGRYDARGFVRQFDRTLAALVGDGAHPSYVEASRLTAEEAQGLAEPLREMFGGNPATWQRALAQAPAALAAFCYRASENMGRHLDEFIKALGNRNVTGSSPAVTATMARLARDPVSTYHRVLSDQPVASRIDYEWIARAHQEMAALAKALEKPGPARKGR